MKYNLLLSQAEIDLLGKGLGELPLKESLALFSVIKMQCVAQEKAVAEAATLSAPPPADMETIPVVVPQGASQGAS